MTENASSTAPESSLSLPVPQHLVLRNFSLYRNRARIDVGFNDGVFCLAGANGLGKSTFLMTLNYALTGAAADPDRKFESLDEYYRYTMPYARSYYAGRISESDRDVASVELTMRVGSHIYVLERGFFEVEALRRLQITGPGGVVVVGHDEAQSDGDRNKLYKEQVVRDCGLAQFEQLVFVQHFIATFDERRRLLLWDERTIEQALLLAFGVSPEQARRADDWRRKAERAESQARNLQYQATTARSRIADLYKRVQPVDDENEVDDQSVAQLEREWAALAARLHRVSADEASAEIAEVETQAQLVSAEQAYEAAFASALQPMPRHHPLVMETLQQDICRVCGTPGARVRLEAELALGHCPLCRAHVEVTAALEDAAALEENDEALARARSSATSASARREELARERQELEEQLLALHEDRPLAEKTAGLHGSVTATAVRALEEQYRLEAEDATRRRTEYRVKRDEYRRLLAPVAGELARRYAAAEERFVPRFTALAYRFLGLEVEVYLQQKGGRPMLVVSVEGSERRTFDQLSESQRYFLDIALRMALVQHIVDGSGEQGCLLIDTPEGSLDISYEARAGNMFADFVASGNRLVMTANINTSRLLQSLATACGPDRMTIMRMMEWTRLSEVQAEGEALFEEALEELDRALTQASSRA